MKHIQKERRNKEHDKNTIEHRDRKNNKNREAAIMAEIAPARAGSSGKHFSEVGNRRKSDAKAAENTTSLGRGLWSSLFGLRGRLGTSKWNSRELRGTSQIVGSPKLGGGGPPYKQSLKALRI